MYHVAFGTICKLLQVILPKLCKAVFHFEMNSLVLGRFQNSSVPVLILSIHSVPVPTGSNENLTFSSGFKSSVLRFWRFYIFPLKLSIFYNIGLFDMGLDKWFNFSVKWSTPNRAFLAKFDHFLLIWYLNFIRFDNSVVTFINFYVKFVNNGRFGYPRFWRSVPILTRFLYFSEVRFRFRSDSGKCLQNRRFLGFG